MRLPVPQFNDENADMFKDEGVVEAYRFRPRYPEEAVTRIVELMGERPRALLDLGCGPGELTRRLAPHVERIDAVDPSVAMIAVAESADSERITWHLGTAEGFAFTGPYDAVISADALHWMDCDLVMPKIAASLTPAGRLIIVARRATGPWAQDLLAIIPRYSGIREYVPVDAVAEWERLGYLAIEGRETTARVVQRQSIEDYIEYHHSMSGFARFRLNPAQSAEFDAELRRLVEPHAEDGVLALEVTAELVWGRPPAVA